MPIIAKLGINSIKIVIKCDGKGKKVNKKVVQSFDIIKYYTANYRLSFIHS